jgi:hypothetical protein
MRRKLVLVDADGKQFWSLDGKTIMYEPVIMLRKGVEMHGVFEAEGDEPPGKPVFMFRVTGDDTEHRVEIDPETDELRRLSQEEQDGLQVFPVKTGLS